MLSPSRVPILLLGFVLYTFCNANLTLGQPLFHTAESLDSWIINSDRVWVAKIVGVRDQPIPGGSKMPGITIAIEETLKYPLFEQRHKRMGLFVKHPTSRYKKLQEAASRLLIAHSDDHQFAPQLIVLAPDKTEVFLADFTVLNKPDAVVQAARAIVRRHPPNVRRLHTFRVAIPRDMVVKSKLGPHGQLMVPVDDQLKKRAMRDLTSKDYLRRYEATRALRYFQSDANVQRLRTLLRDPGYSERTAGNEARTKYYGVRESAYQTLQAWGIKVKRPVIVEPYQ